MSSPIHQSPSSASKANRVPQVSPPKSKGGETEIPNVSTFDELNIEQLTPTQVLMLQRTHGNHYVQRLVERAKHKLDAPTAKPQAASSTAETQPTISANQVDAETVQRRLGFEFEEARWRAWRVENNKVRSAARKEPLHTGTNFKLEGDDTPGEKLANIEFVTEPFDATPGGVNSYLATMKEIIGIVKRITPLAGKPGPGSDATVKAASSRPTYVPANYVNKPQHNLSVDNVALSAGTGNALGSFKMQATSGISLANIPAVMEMFGITPDEKKFKNLKQGGKKKDEIKARMNINDTKHDSLSQSLDRKAPARKIQATQALLGGSPTVARHAIMLLGGEVMYSVAQKNSINTNSQKLLGFLSLMAMNIKGLGINTNGPAKYRLPFLGRNNFVTLFADLDPLQQAALTSGNASSFIRAVVDANNAVPLVQGDGGKTADTPLVNGFPTLQDLTIGVWLKGITTGTDYLDPTKIALLMKGQPKKYGLFNKYSKKDIEKSQDALESFATIPAMDAAGGGDSLAILENRGITSGGFSADFPMDEAVTIGYNYLQYFVDLAAGAVDNNYDYPTDELEEDDEDEAVRDESVSDEVVVIE
jgi:hypothetical protein